MMEPAGERRAPITPQLALRVAIFGGIALALFAIVFFRLWYLQVLSGDKYLAQATVNRVRELRIPAPRGKIVDRAGHEIVRNRQAVVVQLDPAKLPQAERDLAATWGQDVTTRAARPKGHRGDPIKIPPIPSAALRVRYARLGMVLGKSADEIHRQVVHSLVLVPYATIRVKTDVTQAVLSYISERPSRFPGVTVDETYLRDYPETTLAAQILGTVNEIDPEQLGTPRYRGVKPGGKVGTSGLEYQYDRYLRGVDGIERVQVDASGRPVANDRLRRVDPIGGQKLKISLDRDLTRTGDRALRGPLNPSNHPGAYIALDPRNGEILATGSNPTFDPVLFTKELTQKRYDTLFGDAAGAPAFNRALQGGYPTASTFKAITALASLDGGVITPGATINDTGCVQVFEAKRCNARDEAYGTVNMERALQVSSDVYFYKLGVAAYQKRGLLIQNYARRLGFGRPTGIDLPGEGPGVIPDDAWRKRINATETKCRAKRRISQLASVFTAGAQGCGISDLRDFGPGDNASMATGQGDLIATPLQLAVAYGAIENGGKVVTPHLGLEIESDRGELIQRIERDPARRIKMNEADRQVVASGLHKAAAEPGGTSAEVFAGWPQNRYPVYGKTGTAERKPKGDQSWYVAYVPDPKRPIVVAVTVEEGGFGAATAAPIARLLLSQYYNVEKKIIKGTDTSN